MFRHNNGYVGAAEPVSKKDDQSYKGNGNHKWEDAAYDTMRLRVPGGWLYRSGAYPASVAMVFVPMPEVVKHKV